MSRSDPTWRAANRAHWDELVALHLGPRGYDLTALRAGRRRLHAIEEAELPPVAGKRILHLQCHFGADSLTLAQRGAEVVGLDFSAPAIVAARGLVAELHLDVIDATRFASDPPPLLEHVAHFIERHFWVRLQRRHPLQVKLVQLLSLLARHLFLLTQPPHSVSRATLCFRRPD